MPHANSLRDARRGLMIATDAYAALTPDASDDDILALAKTLGWDEYDIIQDGALIKLAPGSHRDTGDNPVAGRS